MSPHPNWYWFFLWLMREHRARVNGRGRSFFSTTDLTTKFVSTEPRQRKLPLPRSNS